MKIGLLEAIFGVTQTNTLANPFGDLYRDLSCFKYIFYTKLSISSA